jgi:hypothetical protein
MGYNRFEHLETKEVVEYDYTNNLLKKSLPIRAFTNTLTSTLVLFAESVLAKTINSTKMIRRYFEL